MAWRRAQAARVDDRGADAHLVQSGSPWEKSDGQPRQIAVCEP